MPRFVTGRKPGHEAAAEQQQQADRAEGGPQRAERAEGGQSLMPREDLPASESRAAWLGARTTDASDRGKLSGEVTLRT
jgi:hypothetical protein